MFYIVENTNQLKIVDSYLIEKEKEPTLSKYCLLNKITFVCNRQEITDKCKDESNYCYKVSVNKYIVLHCKHHPSSLFFSGYVEKKFLYYIDIVHFLKIDDKYLKVIKGITKK